MDAELYKLAEQLGHDLKQGARSLVTAESCTGGGLGAVLTDVPGSSLWYDRGFIVYSNMAKREMLGVKTEILARYGAVSEQTARAMVEGALEASHADLAVAITGIAGPGGGTPEKPVGTVCLAWMVRKGVPATHTERFSGDREAIRRASIEAAIHGLLSLISSFPTKG
ncbi:MAG: CinA family protein [Gammaproteobacteria bacterium]|nr:CinA family protein [Gammaproteobacteria bacterium]